VLRNAAKAGWLATQRAMQVRQSKRLGRPGDVEQQRVRRDDEKQIDRVSEFKHFRTSALNAALNQKSEMSESAGSHGCPKLIQMRRCVAGGDRPHAGTEPGARVRIR
jgi:hypothetical protein